MDPRVMEFAEDWLVIAEEDLRWARASFESGFYSRVCFVCQQVAEKSLKGYLYAQKSEEKSHGLIRLMKMCVKFDSDFERLKDSLVILEPYYLSTRYADLRETERFNRRELAEEAMGAAQRVLEFIKGKMVRGGPILKT